MTEATNLVLTYKQRNLLLEHLEEVLRARAVEAHGSERIGHR